LEAVAPANVLRYQRRFEIRNFCGLLSRVSDLATQIPIKKGVHSVGYFRTTFPFTATAGSGSAKNSLFSPGNFLDIWLIHGRLSKENTLVGMFDGPTRTRAFSEVRQQARSPQSE